MAGINKSATKVGDLLWNNGNEVALFIGENSNTGETIVWQRFAGRVTRITGRNIVRLVTELHDALAKKEARWTSSDAAALATLYSTKEAA